MPSTKPFHQVCPLCSHDDSVETGLVDEVWVMSCKSPTHPLYTWTPHEQFETHGDGHTGVAEELGVYERLIVCADQGLAEHGVVEYRFWELTSAAYKQLVAQYGHKYLQEGLKYSASAFLARALSQLASERGIYGTLVPATGRWKYNGRTGGYGPAGTTATDRCLSWTEFATSTLGIDDTDWPPLSRPAP